jgi:hypothetical protein
VNRVAAAATIGLAACFNVACDRQAATPRHFVIDSAGVAISQNTAPQWTDGDAWTIDTVPHLEIGASNAPGHDLYEVTGVARLSDGRIAVVNSGSSEVRIFSRDGDLLQSLGKAGEGPGEFRSLRRLILLPGDSLLVVDPSLNRITVFAGDGSLVRTAPIEAPPTGSIPAPLARLRDGTLVAFPPFTFGSESGGVSRIVQDTVPLLHYDAGGRFIGELGRFPGSEYFTFIDPSAILGGPRIWGRSTHLAAAGGGFVVGHADAFSFSIHEADGSLSRIVRAHLPNRAVTRADIDRFREPDPEAGPGSSDLFNRVLDALPLPSHFPAYAGIRVDAEDNIWVRRYAWPEGESGEEWHIFDPEGRWLGAIMMPAGFSLERVTTDEVLGIFRDDVDVEHLRAYRLKRGGP